MVLLSIYIYLFDYFRRMVLNSKKIFLMNMQKQFDYIRNFLKIFKYGRYFLFPLFVVIPIHFHKYPLKHSILHLFRAFIFTFKNFQTFAYFRIIFLFYKTFKLIRIFSLSLSLYSLSLYLSLYFSLYL